ncbi:MAG: TonB-dependent receptor [Pseudomonadota bacterium]
MASKISAKQKLASTAACVALCLTGVAYNNANAAEAAVKHENTRQLDLAPGPLREMLERLARLYGANLLFSSGDLEGYQSSAVSGSFTFEQVVRLIADKHSLTIVRVDENTLAIMGDAQSPESKSSVQRHATPPKKPDTIIVTGTRAPTRTLFETLAPVDVLSADILTSSASGELTDSLAQTLPSFIALRLPLNDGLIFNRPTSLRGLSADHTLILINGKRRHRSAYHGHDERNAQASDLTQIPITAIGRIEVLRDGASAQYGSDAIAGVINVILDEKPGYSAFGQFSQYYAGDGDAYRGGAKAGFELGDRGFFVGTFEYSSDDPTSRSRQRPDAIVFQAANPTIDVPDPVQNWGQPALEAYRVAWNADFDLASPLTAYLFGSAGYDEGLSDFNWRNPTTTRVFDQSSAFPDFDLRDIYPAGFTPKFGREEVDLQIVGGAKGAIRDDRLHWDFGVSHGRNKQSFTISNTINASLGPASPTAFHAGTLEQREFNINLDVSSDFDIDGLAAPVNFAFGFERRDETYEITAGDAASFEAGPGAVDGLPPGANGFPGYKDSQAGVFSQVSYAGYVDIEIPVFEWWLIGVAGRYENFSEFGDTFDGKFATRFSLTPELALRGTVSTGFRAPTPAQLFSERTFQSLDTDNLDIVSTGRFSPTGPIADVISAREGITIEPLSPEKALNYTFGIGYNNQNGLTATIDFYQIKVRDRFNISETFFLTDEERSALVSLGVPDGDDMARVQFFQNSFDTRTRGIDAVISYGCDIGPGALSLTSAYNFNDTKVIEGELLNDAVLREIFETSAPAHKSTFSASYELGDFEFFSRLRYYGSWSDEAGEEAQIPVQAFGSEMFLDVALTWRAHNNIIVRIGAENIFNNFPDEATFQENRGLIYSRNAPYDTDGGLYYLRTSLSF